MPPQPKGRQGVTVHLLRCSSSTSMIYRARHRLLLASRIHIVRPCRATIWTSTTGC